MNEEEYSYYRIIQIEYPYYRIIPIFRSDTLLIEKVVNPHSSVLKGLIGLRRVRRKPRFTVSFPQAVTKWFMEHGLLEYFPNRALVIVPFNVDSEEDTNVLMSVVKALYGFKDVRELYREKVRAGRVRAVEAGLDPHYQLFLNAKSVPKLSINDLYDLLRRSGVEA
jgi:hypothetical protein